MRGQTPAFQDIVEGIDVVRAIATFHAISVLPCVNAVTSGMDRLAGTPL